jgi:ABC-type Fe3+ transport system substrate-binding protein
MRQIARFVAFGYLAIVIVVAALQLLGLTQFAPPLNVIPAPARPPIVVSLLYSSEQREWITAAAQQFVAGKPTLRGRPIQLVLQDRGSQAIIASIEQLKPAAIIPASSAQIGALERSGAARPAGGANTPQPVALSPLVLVGWKERTDLLFPPGTQDMWGRLHDALQKQNWGDPDLGGKPEWGPVKFGHASPRTTNSGAETLTLLAYAYSKKAQGLTLGDIGDPKFQRWLQDIESVVSDFPDSTDTLFSSFLARGPSAYDVAVAYENQAVMGIERAKKWGNIQVLYPPATLLSDHPFAVLDAPWVAPEQQDAARMFRDFLLSEPAQLLALHYGFRPANAAVALDANEPSNMFPAAFSLGVQKDLPSSVALPPPEVQEELVKIWQQQTGR